MKIVNSSSCLMFDPHRRNASPGPECSAIRPSSICPNSSVPPWFSTGIRPVSVNTSMKNAAIINRWLGRTTWTAEERMVAPNA